MNFFYFLDRWARIRGGLVRDSVMPSVLPRFSSGLHWEAKRRSGREIVLVSATATGKVGEGVQLGGLSYRAAL